MWLLIRSLNLLTCVIGKYCIIYHYNPAESIHGIAAKIGDRLTISPEFGFQKSGRWCQAGHPTQIHACAPMNLPC